MVELEPDAGNVRMTPRGRDVVLSP